MVMGIPMQVTTMSNSQCRTSYGTTSITNNMICAAAAGKDSCQGDSGGRDTIHFNLPRRGSIMWWTGLVCRL